MVVLANVIINCIFPYKQGIFSLAEDLQIRREDPVPWTQLVS